MTTTEFLIDGQVFRKPLNPMGDSNQFKIQSVPRPYFVKWADSADPIRDVEAVLKANPKNALFIDENVHRIYAKDLDWPADRIMIAPATEQFKTLSGFEKLLEFMDYCQLTKTDKLVVVGGGIIQDVAAFGGAAFKRGLPWVFFPTTLLSQCDSCIGGKTGLNFKSAKNQVALFSAPSEVVINPHFLKTLNDADLMSGLGETLKLLVTGGQGGLDLYTENLPTDIRQTEKLKPLILGALAVKTAVIEVDEFELSLRRSMNYGHTVGHAIESMSKNRIPHGTAVVLGMMIVDEISHRRGLLPKAQLLKLQELCRPLITDEVKNVLRELPLADLGQLLKKDKKTTGNSVNFVVLKEIGKIEFLKAELNDQLLNEIGEITRSLFA